MKWLAKLFESRGSLQTAPMIPRLWESAMHNPTVIGTWQANNMLQFPCPTCTREVSVPSTQIDARRGALWGCRDDCLDHFHIPGCGPAGHKQVNQPVTAGFLVAITDFADWYSRHPVHTKLGGESWMLNEHGLWVFCAACKRQLISTVLCAFVNYQLSQSLGMAGYVFGASNAESAREMNSLQSGECWRCRSKSLVSIMVDIPQHLREDYRRRQ